LQAPPAVNTQEYEFFGRHLLASYVDCDPAALADHAGLKAAMAAAVEAAGATLLNSIHYSFTPSGMTAVLLLAESHASIHTYPEHQACFVDLFTCGRACSAEKFDAVLRQYLRPASVQRRTMLRHADGVEEASPSSSKDWLAEWAA
jgi:S-adenosylmethionine decarboxylase